MIPCSSVSHFMRCWWVWVAKRCSIPSQRGSGSIGGVLGVGEVGAGQVGADQGRDARRRTVKSVTLRPAVQKLATARSVGAIYLWFVIGDSGTHLRSTKCVRVPRSEIRKVALSDTVLICRHSIGRGAGVRLAHRKQVRTVGGGVQISPQVPRSRI
jgi:hypothetical protein